ncbi:hypothetical protein [Nostoc sp. FACHB-190]|uniref:hypothetical protein n=1 Tax=Nostoc sp. FACHB-190 TaxID=2692838 RepID=UPI0016870683|nr:hypothetical protein [Nostoc sp. FACHB-190]MBD2302880.1 hypothetical protein [Nostoc sp. FACHB-190]
MCNVGHNCLSPLWMKAIANFLRVGGRFWFLRTNVVVDHNALIKIWRSRFKTQTQWHLSITKTNTDGCIS